MSRLTMSVITPSFNQGDFIECTIKSVLGQSVSVQYLVMDGGSTDQTAEILHDYRQKNPKNLSYVMESDNGQAHAVNKGLMQAVGDIIGWINSDDYYLPGVFEMVLDFFEKNPEIDILYGDKIFVDKKNKPLNYYPVEKMKLSRLKQTCIMPQPATFFRRKIVDPYGMLNESLNFCMDYEFWLRLALAKVKFSYIKKTFAVARVYEDCKTVGGSLKAHKEKLDMLYSKLNYYPEQAIFAYANAIVAKNKCDSSFGQIFIGSSLLREWKGLVKNFNTKRSDRVVCYLKTPFVVFKYAYVRALARVRFVISKKLS
jgi:glycosyltransferase involved in cell wall biosynthesis